jgi:hypothetical protein
MAFTEATPLRARRPSRKAVSNTVILAAFLAACALVAHLTRYQDVVPLACRWVVLNTLPLAHAYLHALSLSEDIK